MRIGLVSGGFKQYHKGHHFMVEQAAAENDRVIVITSPFKGRDEIKDGAMLNVWNEVIIPNFPLPNVDFEFTRVPVRRVFEMLEELESGAMGDDTTLNIYGGAEDLNARFKSDYLMRKFPQSYGTGRIELKPLVRGQDSPVASGTATREALALRDHVAFRDALPDFLKNKAGLIIQMLL